MTATEILKMLERDLRRSIKECNECLKQGTDTGTMWQSMAYKEILDRIKALRKRDAP